MVWVAATIVAIFSWLGVLATLMVMPGMWLMLLVALIAKLIVPDVISWWVLLAGLLLAILGEIVELISSALGAKAGGAGKPGTTGALVGGIAGAIAGTVFIPIPVLGTIIGGVIGAGALALIMERNTGDRTWKEAGKAGAGAAAGRLASTFLKTAVAVVMAIVLTVGAFWPNVSPKAARMPMLAPETPPADMIVQEPIPADESKPPAPTPDG